MSSAEGLIPAWNQNRATAMFGSCEYCSKSADYRPGLELPAFCEMRSPSRR